MKLREDGKEGNSCSLNARSKKTKGNGRNKLI
jgi:hypothetical protein